MACLQTRQTSAVMYIRECSVPRFEGRFSYSEYYQSSATLTEVFPCFFLSCKTNAGVKLAKMGHGPHSSIHCSVVICVVLCIVCV